MGLRGTEARLPPGFRFHPTDEELICHYLHRKINSNSQADHDHHQGDTMVEVDLHTCEPWNLPVEAKLGSNEWYFFSFRDRKYATGLRTNRATTHGYWKATGKDKMVVDPGGSNSIVGMRKTLVFYRGRAPKGIKSRWVMHEFRRENPYAPPQEDWVLCRVFYQTRGESNASIASKEHDHDHGHDNDPNHNIIDDTFIFDQQGQYFNMMQPSHVHHGHFGQTSSFPPFSYHGSSSATPHNIDNMRLECESLPSLVDHEEDNSLGFLNEDWKGRILLSSGLND